MVMDKLWTICWFANLVSFVCCQTLTISPAEPQTKNIDTNIILTCTVSDLDLDASTLADEVDLKWRGPDRRFIEQPNGRIHVERDNNDSVKLYIDKLSRSDEGQYVCELFVNGQQFVKDTELLIYEDIQFDNTPTSVIGSVKGQVLLRCAARGQPKPDVSWRFGGKTLTTDENKYRVEKDGLRIRDVQVEDAGEYECRAEVDSQGNLKIRIVSLDVQYAPRILNQSRNEHAIKGRKTSLKCEANGNPAVKYEWLREIEVSEYAKVKSRIPGANESTLTFSEVQIQDGGRYFCRATNSLGMVETHMNIHVLVPPSVDEFVGKTAVERRIFMWSCQASGIPTPTIHWHRLDNGKIIGEEIQPNGADISVESIVPGVSKLLIQSVQRGHSGDYQCIAVNKHGNDSRTATLVVEFAPFMISMSDGQLAWSGQTRNLTCTAGGLPLPKLQWSRGKHSITDHDGTRIISTRSLLTSISTLEVTVSSNKESTFMSSWIYANYTCTAKNHHGHATGVVELRQAVLPDMPRNAAVLLLTHSSVTLQVSPADTKQDGLPVSGWKISYEQEFGKSNQTSENGINTRQFNSNADDPLVVDGLAPDSLYTFYIFPGNEIGYGQPMKIQVHTTPVIRDQLDVPARSPASGARTSPPEVDDAAALGGKSPVISGDPSDPSSTSANLKKASLILGILSVAVALAAVAVFVVRKKLRAAHRGEDKSDEEAAASGNEKDNVSQTDKNTAVRCTNEQTVGGSVAHQPPEVPPHGTARRPDDRLPDVVFTSGDESAFAVIKSLTISPKQSRYDTNSGATTLIRYSPSPKLTHTHASTMPLRGAVTTPPNGARRLHQLPSSDFCDEVRNDDVIEEDFLSDVGDDGELDGVEEKSIHDILNGYHSGDNMDEDELGEDDDIPTGSRTN